MIRVIFAICLGLSAAHADEVADVLAIEADVEYGEYLASACVTCHQADGSDQGLPAINGWDQESFIAVMLSFKNKDRENVAMQAQAAALGMDELAALAAYFEQQEGDDQ